MKFWNNNLYYFKTIYFNLWNSQKYPSWGARRIKHQFDLPVHWKIVHNVTKRKGMLIKIKAKPQPCKRFARHHVDSMWQGDTFQFRIRGLGKVYVTGFTDDCSKMQRVQLIACNGHCAMAEFLNKYTLTMESSLFQRFSSKKLRNTELN